jgi:hypothetical protein
MSLRFYSLTAGMVRVFWNLTLPRFIGATDLSVTDVLKFRKEDEESTFFHKIG